MNPIRIDKAWGYEEVVANEAEYCLKRLVIQPKKKCSLHFHRVKKETFFVQSGLVRLEQKPNLDELLKPNESRVILPLTPHRFSSVHGAVLLEVSTHHSDDDVVRIEPSGDV